MSPGERIGGRLLVVFLVVGVVARLVGLGVHSLWIDEAGTLYVARSEDLVAVLRGDRHPPLSFLLFRWWSALVGQGDAWLRLAPALASIGSLFLLARLARAWLEPGAAWLAVALLALSPLELWIAREVRMYAFVELAALAALVAACAHLERPRAWFPAIVFASAAVATGMHYFGAFVGPTVVLVLGARSWRDPARLRRAAWPALAALCGSLVWLPWFTTVYRDQAAVAASFLSNFGPRTLVEFPARLFVPTTDMLPAWCVGVAYAAAALVTVACLTSAIELARKRSRGHVAAFLVLATAPACALLAALFGPLSFLARYFPMSAPGAALVVATGCLALPWKVARGALAASLLAAFATVAVAIHAENDREDWRTACEHVARAFVPGDRILALTHLTDPYSEAPLRHYWRERPDLVAALTTLAEAREASSPRPRLHVVYRETRYVEAEYRDLASRYRIVSTETLHGAIHRMILE